MRRLLPRRVALGIRREWLARQVVSGRAHREGDVDFLDRFVGSSDVCWDIGANTGTFTIALSRLCDRVWAFEPVPHNVDVLKTVVRLGRLNNVTIEQAAISDSSGVRRILVPVEGFYGGFYIARLDDLGDLEVRVNTIDQLIAEGIPRPQFIKCDVEGAEVAVVKGAQTLISTKRPTWLIETFEDELLPLMKSLGYAAYVNRGGEGRFEAVDRRLSSDRNYWFIPAEQTLPLSLQRPPTGPMTSAGN